MQFIIFSLDWRDCKISKPISSLRSHKERANQPLMSVPVEGNDILDGIVGQADENNVIQAVNRNWFVTTLDGSYEIELVRESAEQSEFVQHTLRNGKRFVSRRVV